MDQNQPNVLGKIIVVSLGFIIAYSLMYNCFGKQNMTPDVIIIDDSNDDDMDDDSYLDENESMYMGADGDDCVLPNSMLITYPPVTDQNFGFGPGNQSSTMSNLSETPSVWGQNSNPVAVAFYKSIM